MPSYRDRIDTIRKDYEQIGEPAYGLDNLIAQSLDDYSSPFPFILELIQNSVDSASNGTRVKIDISLRREAGQLILVFSNNGEPFSIHDIERLCGVAKERKDRKKIGYKGVGFKTVIRVTDNPQIYSRNCQFEFNKCHYPEHEHFWILVPHWIESAAAPIFIKPQSAWVTFVLPIRADIADALHLELDNLSKRLSSLLLFLDNLEELSISDHILGKSSCIYKRTDSQQPLLHTIFRKSEDGSETRLSTYVVTHYPSNDADSLTQLPPDAAKEYATKRGHTAEIAPARPFRQGIISLAFRILHDPHSQRVRFSQKDGDKGTVCAFFPVGLPGEEYGTGLRFAVQADFLTSQNRESLLPNSIWNAWIISNLPQAIWSAVQEFKRNPEWYSFIYDALPLEDEGKGVFAQVTQELCGRLRNSRTVLTDLPDPWKKPGEVVWPDNPKLREIIGNSDLAILSQEGKALASSRISSDEINGRRAEALLGKKGLKVQRFNSSSLLNHLRNQEWLNSKRDDIDWFERLFLYLSEEGIKDQNIRSLEAVKIIPTTAKNLAEFRQVFFVTDPSIGLPGVLFVHEQLARNERVRALLSGRLGVPNGTYEKIIERIVFARSPHEKDEKVLAEYVAFVKAYHDSGTARPDLNSGHLAKLKNCLRLQARDKSWRHIPELCFSQGQEESDHTHPILYPETPDLESWKRFFHWLGIRQEPIAEPPPIPRLAPTKSDLHQASPEALVLEISKLGEDASLADHEVLAETSLPQESDKAGENLQTLKTQVSSDPAEVKVAKVEEPSRSYLTQRKGCKGEALAFFYIMRRLLEMHAARPSLHHVEDGEGGFSIQSGDRIIAEGYWPNAGCLKSETHEESGWHYDFHVRTEDGSTDYYEVKATDKARSETDDSFDLSDEEWACAQEHGSKYHIVRVYGVAAEAANEISDKPEADFLVIDNPLRLIGKGTLTLKIKSSSNLAFHANRQLK